MYEVVFSDKAERQLRKLERSIQERVIAVLERIRMRPESYVDKLVGEPGYKIRVGDYRAILDVGNENMRIIILKVGHRKNIYDFR